MLLVVFFKYSCSRLVHTKDYKNGGQQHPTTPRLTCTTPRVNVLNTETNPRIQKKEVTSLIDIHH